jgi:hypothetical protein
MICFMRVGFYTEKLGIRGSEATLWLYAHGNETLLGNRSIIFTQKNRLYPEDPGLDNTDITEESIRWFTDRFEVVDVDTNNLDDLLVQHKIDVCLLEVAGRPSDLSKIPTSVPTITHCMFSGLHPMGTIHTVISEHIAKGTNAIVLPNIIEVGETKENLRASLGIPADAIVFGRYGGYRQFDLPLVHQVVARVAEECPHIYFLFMNTRPFCDPLPNVIHLPSTRDFVAKRKFINTCDAMLHARSDGETFGCACGEFAVCGKPILTAPVGDIAHIDILGPQALIYRTVKELVDMLVHFPLWKTRIQTDPCRYAPFNLDACCELLSDLLVRATTNAGASLP